MHAKYTASFGWLSTKYSNEQYKYIISSIYQCGRGAGGEGAHLTAVVAVGGVRRPTAARVVVSVHPPAAVHVLAGVVAVVGVGPAGVEKLGHLTRSMSCLQRLCTTISVQVYTSALLASAANVCRGGAIYRVIDKGYRQLMIGPGNLYVLILKLFDLTVTVQCSREREKKIKIMNASEPLIRWSSKHCPRVHIHFFYTWKKIGVAAFATKLR